MSALVRPGWWRRNAIPLAAMLLAIGATVAVGVVVPVLQYQSDHGRPAATSAGRDAHAGAATFRLLKAGVFHPDGSPGVEVPKGSMIVAVLIRVTTERSLPSTCGVTLVHDGTDTISWNPIPDPSRYRYEVGESTEHSCDLSAGAGSRILEETYLVPADVYDHVSVEVSVSGRTASGVRTAELALPAKPFSDLTR